MSKLSQKIRRVTRVEPAPMGFGTASRARIATMLLVGLAPDRWTERASQAASQGIDILILGSGHGTPRERDVQEAVDAADEVVCGVQFDQAEQDTMDPLRQAGIDFIVFQAERTGAAALLDEGLGYVLHLNQDLSDIYLRTLEDLPLDAILVPWPEGPLTVRAQMEFRRIAGLSRTPLLVAVPRPPDASDLQCLRDAGAAGVALDLSQRGSGEALPALRQAIDSLPPRRLRRQEPAEPLLPTTAPPSAEEEEEEEEE